MWDENPLSLHVCDSICCRLMTGSRPLNTMVSTPGASMSGGFGRLCGNSLRLTRACFFNFVLGLPDPQPQGLLIYRVTEVT